MRHRLLFYSHDSYGLGHFRRSLTIASYLARHIEGLSILMLTGSDSAAAFEAPPGVDFVKLPSIWKSGPEQYRSRHLRVSFQRVRRIRETMIHTVARAFDPTLVVVDNVPRGAEGELLPLLRWLRRHRPEVRIALTMRDILDAPETVVSQWRAQGMFSVLRRYYDEIWVAGVQAVFDPIVQYQLPPALVPRVKFCGHLARSTRAEDVESVRQELCLGTAPLVVVSCGGGGDGYALVRTYAEIAASLGERGVHSAVFLGPDMPAVQRRALKQRLLPLSERVHTYDFRTDLVAFLRLASMSISMAGYNTVCELMALGTPAVVVPRTYPRVEQLLRAEAFANLGLLRVVRPEALSPATLRREVELQLNAPAERRRRTPVEGLDFAGLSRVARRVRKHLGVQEAAGQGE